MQLSIGRLRLVGCLLALMLASGCGSDNIYPVRGQVTFDGKPMVGGGSITLIPLSAQEGMVAGGEIGADGKYMLTTQQTGDGSMPGEFKVLIYQITEQEPGNTEDGEKAVRGTRVMTAAERIPEVYSTPSSPLTMKVEAKDVNEIDFDLKRE